MRERDGRHSQLHQGKGGEGMLTLKLSTARRRRGEGEAKKRCDSFLSFLIIRKFPFDSQREISISMRKQMSHF
jgi:hypothetical protein